MAMATKVEMKMMPSEELCLLGPDTALRFRPECTHESRKMVL